MDTRYYELYIESKMRENEIESLYRDLMYINRLDLPNDMKYHMRNLLKIEYQDRKIKRNMDKVIKEIKLYSFYSWGLFKGSDMLTIIEEAQHSTKVV